MNVVHLFLSILLFSNSQDLLRFMFASAIRIFLYFFFVGFIIDFVLVKYIYIIFILAAAPLLPLAPPVLLHSTSNCLLQRWS